MTRKRVEGTLRIGDPQSEEIIPVWVSIDGGVLTVGSGTESFGSWSRDELSLTFFGPYLRIEVDDEAFFLEVPDRHTLVKSFVPAVKPEGQPPKKLDSVRATPPLWDGPPEPNAGPNVHRTRRKPPKTRTIWILAGLAVVGLVGALVGNDSPSRVGTDSPSSVVDGCSDDEELLRLHNSGVEDIYWVCSAALILGLPGIEEADALRIIGHGICDALASTNGDFAAVYVAVPTALAEQGISMAIGQGALLVEAAVLSVCDIAEYGGLDWSTALSAWKGGQ